MRTMITISLLSISLFSAGCSQKIEEAEVSEKIPTAEETQLADEASLLEAAKAAGVSDAEALAAKAELDKVYDETSAKMSDAEAERIARMKQLKNEACIENCSE